MTQTSCLQETHTEVQEFARLSDDAHVFKLVGPVLLKQDKTDAVMAVDGRLDFIEKEMYLAHFCIVGEAKVLMRVQQKGRATDK